MTVRTLIEQATDLFEYSLCHDRLVSAGMDMALVTDLSEVDRIAQDVEQRSAAERVDPHLAA